MSYWRAGRRKIMDVGVPAPLKLSVNLLKVLDLMAAGKTTKEIAATLFKSRGTIDSQRMDIFAKLGACTAAQAVAIAMRNGLIT